MIVAVGTYAACVDDDPSNPGFQFDGGGLDAASPDGTTPETGVPPVGIDAGGDAAPAPVTVILTRAGAPASGVTVVFHDASGAVLDTRTTDASGQAAMVVPAGSQVTAVFGTVTNPELVTIAGVEPGDVLRAAEPLAAAQPPFPSIDIESAPASPPAGTAYYVARVGSCSNSVNVVDGGQTGPINVTLDPGCTNGSTVSVVVEAKSAGSATLGFASLASASIADAGVVTPMPVDVGGTWADAGAQALQVVGADPVASGNAVYSEIMNSGAISSFTNVVGNADGGPLQLSFEVHPGVAANGQYEVNYREDLSSGVAFRAIAGRSASGGSPSIDVAQMMPALTAADVDAGVPARPAVTWASSTPVTADGLFVRVRWWESPTDGGPYVSGHWTMVVPPQTQVIQAPQLPPALAAYAPSATSSVNQTPTLVFVDSSLLPGYRELRQVSASVGPSQNMYEDRPGGGLVPILPADGTLKLTAVTEPID